MVWALALVALVGSVVGWRFWLAELALRLDGSLRELGLSRTEPRFGVDLPGGAKVWSGEWEDRALRAWTIRVAPWWYVPPRTLLAIGLHHSTAMGWQVESGEREPIHARALGPVEDLVTRSTGERLDAPRFLPTIRMDLSVSAERTAEAEERLTDPETVAAIAQLQERASLGIWDEVIVTMLADSPTREELTVVIAQMVELAERLETTA